MSSSKLTAEEWNIICAVEQFWADRHFFPGLEELSEITTYDKEFIEITLGSDRAVKRFSSLGIDTKAVPLAKRGELKKNQTRLTDKQLAVAMTILNPMDKRGHTRKLDSLGVLPVTYNGWMKNKTFTDFMRQQAEEMFGDAMPMAQEALVRKMMTGDTGALKLYMEMTGRYNKNQVPTQDFKMLVFRLIEILQKHIKDPKLLQLLSEEIKILIEPNPAREITQGEIIYDNDPAIRS